LEASLVYKVSSRTARAIQRNPVSKKKKKERKIERKKGRKKGRKKEALWIFPSSIVDDQRQGFNQR
jgi:hypothetical protein